MAIHQAFLVRNRLLTAMVPDDFDLLSPKLERVQLPLGTTLIEAHQPITHVVFPESGLVSTIADTDEGRIEVAGSSAVKGVSGVPVILGANQTPHTYPIQGVGEGLRIGTQDLRDAMRERPSIFTCSSCRSGSTPIH